MSSSAVPLLIMDQATTTSPLMTASARYNPSKIPATTHQYHDDDDDDLDALREAALQTLNSKKRKRSSDRSRQSLSRSSSRSYSSSSRSSQSYSSTSRSSSLSTISSHSLDAHDKDYRFESKDKPSTGDIDERFPQDNDMLIVDCPLQDDDLLLSDERPPSINVTKPKTEKKPADRDERSRHKPAVKEVSKRREETKKKRSPSHERPVSSNTAKVDSKEFDLRQLIKKRRTEETDSSETSRTDQRRTVQMRSNGNQLTVHKTIQSRSSSSKSRPH